MHVGYYYSDEAGAFDRMKRDRLIVKLRALGLVANLDLLVGEWLDQRVYEVIINGARSETNVKFSWAWCFQGTVLGPLLWAVYYADA